MLKSAGRFFITRRPFLNDLSRFSAAFAFHGQYLFRTPSGFSCPPIPCSTARFHVLMSPASLAVSPLPTSTGTVITTISSASPLSKSKSPRFAPCCYRTFAVRFYSPQFRLPRNKPHRVRFSVKVDTAARRPKSLCRRERPAQMVRK